MVFYVIMGVSGCGKTTIGERLAKELKFSFKDADDFHTSANKNKMNQGIALTDEDRLPWLISIHNHIKSFVNSGQGGIVACSALKKNYRRTLLTGRLTGEASDSIEKDIVFIYLKGSDVLIKERLLRRKNHFMPADLLDSQLAILEEPDGEEYHITVNIDKDVENIIQELINVM